MVNSFLRNTRMPPTALESLDHMFQHCSSMEHDFLMPNGIVLTLKVFTHMIYMQQ